jgi:hypothetical protein
MKRILICGLFMACAAGQLGAQMMPVWLTPFPGATPESKRTDTTVEASYSVAAVPKDVLAHFQKVFDGEGIPIDSIGAPEGFYLHAEAPECNLEISIVRSGANTAVKVKCTSKAGSVQRMVVVPVGDQADPEPANPMKKFDKPVPPGGKAGPPVLSWPDWLVRVDGAKAPVRKLPGELKSTFVAAGPRHDIESFYMDLLNAHDYQVSENLPMGSDDSGNWLLATSAADPKTKHATVIRVKMKPAGQNFEVEITME